jgi:PAS domain S-box-containing protein
LSSPRTHPPEAARLDDLRNRAASRLTGAAATTGSPIRAADALTVLHSLASSPETAPAALTLLHELQVHQVELELQAQELRESRQTLEDALRRQIELYDSHPAGCLTLDHRRVVQDINRAAAEVLGVRREDASGLPFDAFFGLDDARRFGTVVASLEAGSNRASCVLTLTAKDGSERSVLASIGPDPAGRGYLVGIAPLADEADLPPGARPNGST